MIWHSKKVTVWRAPRSLILGAHERNITVLKCENRTIVIDPGVHVWQRKLLTSFPSIDEIWLTHAHPDHCAVAGALQSKFGCKLLCSEHEKKIVRNPSQFFQEEYRAAGSFKDEILPRFLQPLDSFILRIIYGKWASANVDATFEELGMKQYNVEAMQLPGHTTGSIGFCLFENDRNVMVIGDLIQQRVGSEPVLSINLPRSDLDQAFSSLRKIQSMRPDILIPAHGEIIEGADVISSAIENVIQKYHAYEEKMLLSIEDWQEIPPLAYIAKKVPFTWPQSYPTSFTQKRALVFAVLKSLYHKGRLPTRLNGLEKLQSLPPQVKNI
ncbi:MAG: MBL fold metallo-hydrolase [bacterium]